MRTTVLRNKACAIIAPVASELTCAIEATCLKQTLPVLHLLRMLTISECNIG